MNALAYFVTGHGFGHAARAAAVLEALLARRPDLEIHLFTTVPRWLFDDSLGAGFVYHPMRTDVGFVQQDPLVEDLPATVDALTDFWAAKPVAVEETAATLERLGVDLVMSDVSPLGLSVAGALGVPGVLVENFTWDWIYEAYLKAEPRLGAFAARYREAIDSATLRIQAEPICRRVAGGVVVGPIARPARADRSTVRGALGIDAGDDRPLILLTMGGMGWRRADAARVTGNVVLVTLGGVDSLRREDDWVALPDRSPIYPPDLTAAADLVVGKLGYSTVAECVAAGTRLLFLERPSFAESSVLASFCRRQLGAEATTLEAVETGEWFARVPTLLDRPEPEPGPASGASEVADLVVSRWG